jgi:hypothetical protein
MAHIHILEIMTTPVNAALDCTDKYFIEITIIG